jgi:DNA-binding NarL/FixJ family response regulator
VRGDRERSVRVSAAGYTRLVMVEEHTGQPRTRLRTVLVDDEDGLRTLLRSMLDQHGCCEVVAEAGDGAAAVEMLRDVACDLVIIDCEMPGLDGPHATGLIRRQHQDLEIVAYTARTDDGTTERFLEAGASRVFPKGDLDDLVAYVASCVP